MSLEENVQSLTLAVHRLCELIEAEQMQLPFPPPEEKKPEPKKEERKPKEDKKPKPEPEPEPEPAPEAQPEDAQPDDQGEPAPEAQPEPEPAPQEDEDGENGAITLTDLRGVGKIVLKAGKSQQMRELITANGAESLTTLDPEKYATVFAGLKTLASQ